MKRGQCLQKAFRTLADIEAGDRVGLKRDERATIIRSLLPSEAGVRRDVAQPGSAPEWGSGGRGFKSRRPDLVSDGTAVSCWEARPAMSRPLVVGVPPGFHAGAFHGGSPIGFSQSYSQTYRCKRWFCAHCPSRSLTRVETTPACDESCRARLGLGGMRTACSRDTQARSPQQSG
jgi:hypothetical protein